MYKSDAVGVLICMWTSTPTSSRTTRLPLPNTTPSTWQIQCRVRTRSVGMYRNFCYTPHHHFLHPSATSTYGKHGKHPRPCIIINIFNNTLLPQSPYHSGAENGLIFDSKTHAFTAEIQYTSEFYETFAPDADLDGNSPWPDQIRFFAYASFLEISVRCSFRLC